MMKFRERNREASFSLETNITRQQLSFDRKILSSVIKRISCSVIDYIDCFSEEGRNRLDG